MLINSLKFCFLKAQSVDVQHISHEVYSDEQSELEGDIENLIESSDESDSGSSKPNIETDIPGKVENDTPKPTKKPKTACDPPKPTNDDIPEPPLSKPKPGVFAKGSVEEILLSDEGITMSRRLWLNSSVNFYYIFL